MFQNLIGNAAVKTQLQRMLEAGTLPAVLLFHGPAGVGKRRFAEELSLHLLASTGTADRHPDLHHYFPDKNGMHSIASMRELIAETAFPPFSAPAKVFLIHSAEKMLPASSNALLKTLEEPPPATWIILLATDASAMLSTILSRCRPIAFRPLSPSEIASYIKTRYPDEPEDTRLTHFAEGSLEKVEALRAKTDDAKKNILLELMQKGLFKDTGRWMGLFHRLEETLKESDKEKEEPSPEDRPGESLFSALLYWIRDLCLLQAGGSIASLYYHEHQEVLQAQAAQLQPLHCLRLYSLFERAQDRIACNMRLATVLEDILLRLPRQL